MSESIEDGNGRATVTVGEDDQCPRVYTLTSTAALRDGRPDNPRVVVEQDGAPRVRTGSAMFDALYALALEEARECSVDEIRDGSFNDGEPVPCGEGGCFETGRLWKYVWTRDTAYAVDLGLAALDPSRARNSLEFKLSERRGGGDLQIVQDTGTGGSYPISTDRVAWAVGAATLLNYLDGEERAAFAERALEALTNTLEQDRKIAYDPQDGLYRGEQSFLDWREQSYPQWTAQDVVHIGMSKALSTNVLHYRAMILASELAGAAGDNGRRDRYGNWAEELRSSINQRFWLETEGLYSTFITTTLDPSATRRYDLLGTALAVTAVAGTAEQVEQPLGAYPHLGPAAPVQWPQQQDTPIYHNRAEWPFVNGYWLRAARIQSNSAVLERMVHALMRGAALNLSNMENFEVASGAAWREDGESSGPVVNSQRQLWSVAAYVGMVHHVVFGLNGSPGGLWVQPAITVALHEQLFGGASEIVLEDFRYLGHSLTVVIKFPQIPADVYRGLYQVARVALNDEVFLEEIPRTALAATNRIEVQLASSGPTREIHERDDTDWTQVFQPRTPRISSITENAGRLQLGLDRNGETEPISFRIYRDGEAVGDVPGDAVVWTDEQSDADAASSPCYALEACFVSSGNCSQHSPPICWWGRDYAHIQTVTAENFSNVGGTPVTNHGRFHYEGWGDDGHSLAVAGFRPNHSGQHLLQVVYGNGAHDVTTGVTCGVKRVYVEDEETGAVVGEGALVMPHLGSWDRWADSNFVPVDMNAARTYRVVIESHEDYVNMSAFSHFEVYTGGPGGRDGAFNRVNIAELKVLFKP